MLEIIAAGGGGGYYPDSGPGPKNLRRGSTTLGYFGDLGPEALFTAESLVKAIGLDVEITSTESLLWVKGFYNEQVVYYPTQGLFANMTWDQLYAAGLVYGDGTTGAVPGPTPTDQRVMVSAFDGENKKWFWVRLPRINEADPATQTVDPNSEFFGYYGKTMTYSNEARWATGEWDEHETAYTTGDYIVTLNTNSSNATQYWAVNTLGGLTPGNKATGNSPKIYILPVLQLVDLSTTVMDVVDVGVELLGPNPIEAIPAKASQPGFVPVSSIQATLSISQIPTASANFGSSVVGMLDVTTTVEGVKPTVASTRMTNTVGMAMIDSIKPLVAYPVGKVSIDGTITPIVDIDITETPSAVSSVNSTSN